MKGLPLALPDPLTEPTVSIERAGALLGRARSAAYALADSGAIPTIDLGSRRVVPTQALLEMLGVPRPAADHSAEVQKLCAEARADLAAAIGDVTAAIARVRDALTVAETLAAVLGNDEGPAGTGPQPITATTGRQVGRAADG